MKRLLIGISILITAATVFAQVRRPFGGFMPQYEPRIVNPEYDGRFTFARVKYTSGPGGFYYRGLPAWAHGYFPEQGLSSADRNLMQIMNEISFLHPRVEESVVFSADDPEFCHYPVAYMTEPGFWTLTDKEAEGFRGYLLKGGFLIVDDFRATGDPRAGGGWENFEANMKRILPEGRIVDLDAQEQIFHSFFEIDSFSIVPQYYDVGRPIFRGIFENNDPKKRLMVIVNYNTDISNFWEFSSTGFRPIDESNEAYKLGVNYVIYGMTH
jgi:hypothetical protein